MQLDARRVGDRDRLDAEICIIGGGPAGLSLAGALADHGRSVLLLESGATSFDPRIDGLNDGAVHGDDYAGLRATRRRGAGGAVQLWNTVVAGEPGAKYTPLDPVDFTDRAAGALGGWPFGYAHIEPFYRRAQHVCGLGPFAYGSEEWSGEGLRPLATAGDRITTRVYHFGTARVFTDRKLVALREADNVAVCLHATVRSLEVRHGRVTAIDVVDSTGRPVHVVAETFVLAAGAVENARLLLVSLDETSVPAATRDWIGRCFMEHPRDRALTLRPRSPALFREAAFYDAWRAPDGTCVGGRLGIAERALCDSRLPNASVTLLPRPRVRFGFTRLVDRIRRPPPAAYGGYGWSRLRDVETQFDAFRLVVNVEQRPHPENRIVLADTRDRFDVPCAALHWRWRIEEQAGVERLRRVIAEAFEDASLGTIEIAHRGMDPNAHHHAGTTRMAEDERYGVVDGDGRVHGFENLYVTGASVFPTAGFANPTLTIVALALRLAERLSSD